MAFMRSPLYILMQDGEVRIYYTGADPENPEAEKWLGSFEQKLFDDIVLMRYYNMTDVERREVIDRVLETQFETGADGVRKASGLPRVMEVVRDGVSIRNWPPNSGGLETIDKY